VFRLYLSPVLFPPRPLVARSLISHTTHSHLHTTHSLIHSLTHSLTHSALSSHIIYILIFCPLTPRTIYPPHSHGHGNHCSAIHIHHNHYTPSLTPSCHSPPPPPAQVIRGRSSPNSVECAHKRRAVTSVRAAACPTAPSRAAAHTRTHVANNLPPRASANYWMTLVRVLILVLIREEVIK
jgi:hypothetical protein